MIQVKGSLLLKFGACFLYRIAGMRTKALAEKEFREIIKDVKLDTIANSIKRDHYSESVRVTSDNLRDIAAELWRKFDIHAADSKPGILSSLLERECCIQQARETINSFSEMLKNSERETIEVSKVQDFFKVIKQSLNEME